MFRFLTAGESHGKSLLAIIEGIPANLEIDINFINHELSRRQKGYGRSERMTIENDKVEILSGVRNGFTIGSPISILIHNKDWINWELSMGTEPVKNNDIERIKAIESVKITSPRPGHADLCGYFKFNQKDIRNVVERSSARETCIRVAIGAIAKILLKEFNIKVFSHVLSIGGISVDRNILPDNYDELIKNAEDSDLRCACFKTTEKMKELIDQIKEEGDSVGGIFEVIVTGVPIGLGSYTNWDKRLDGILAQAIVSIPGVKGVEIGAGFKQAYLKSSDLQDEIMLENNKIKRKTNNAGGIEGGVSNGEPIILRGVIKPVATIRKRFKTIDLGDLRETTSHFERADICVVPSAGVIAESMVSIILAQLMQDKFGGNSIEEMKNNWKNYQEVCDEQISRGYAKI